MPKEIKKSSSNSRLVPYFPEKPESVLETKESELKRRESELEKRESELEKRELRVQERESKLDKQRSELDKRQSELDKQRRNPPNTIIDTITRELPEWDERYKFHHDTPRNIHSSMKRESVPFTLKNLKEGKGLNILTLELTLINKSLIVQDSDKVPLVFFLKRGLRWLFDKEKDVVKQGYQAIETLRSHYPPPASKSKDKRHQENQESTAHSKPQGVYHFAFWHAIGHTHQNPVVSRDIVKGAGIFNKVSTFFRDFAPITQSVGAFLEIVDAEAFKEYSDNFSKKTSWESGSGGHIFATSSRTRNCFLGMAVLIGLCCGLHRDSLDKVHGWAADMAFGEFEGGFLQVPQLGIQFNLRPGDVLFMRSAILQHSVSPVTSGERFGTVLFTHESMFDSM
jgi:hypothetical protein